jgi:hypothetical protein
VSTPKTCPTHSKPLTRPKEETVTWPRLVCQEPGCTFSVDTCKPLKKDPFIPKEVDRCPLCESARTSRIQREHQARWIPGEFQAGDHPMTGRQCLELTFECGRWLLAPAE